MVFLKCAVMFEEFIGERKQLQETIINRGSLRKRTKGSELHPKPHYRALMTGFPLLCSRLRAVARSLLILRVYLVHQELLPKEVVEYKEWQVYWLQQFLVSGLKKGNKNLCHIQLLGISV